MSFFNPTESQLCSLKGQVVVITGGANGIGAATVRRLAKKGAAVVFGDIDASAAHSLIASINEEHRVTDEYLQAPGVHFVPVDASIYSDNVGLFDSALRLYGRVDHAISVAGIAETGSWFEPDLTIEDIANPPSTSTLDVNLLGVCFFARVAAAYLRHSRQSRRGNDLSQAQTSSSLTLMSSVLGFKAGARIPMYSVSKHGVLGLMRSLEKALPRYGVRVNAVCPWVTDTNIVKGLTEGWERAGFALNTAEDVAEIIVKLTSLPRSSDTGANGMALYVEGGRAWDVQVGLDREEGRWWGEELSKEYERSEVMAKAWADRGGHLKSPVRRDPLGSWSDVV